MHLNHLLASLALALPALASTSIYQLGCYSTVPALRDAEQYRFQSYGYCEIKCMKAGYRVAALSDGTTCSCSHELPNEADKVDDAKCNIMCTGFPVDNCGGKTAYSVLSIGEYAAGSNNDSSAAAASSTIIIAPTTINPSSIPTEILTAPSSMVSKVESTSTATKSAGPSAAVTSVGTSASASPTFNAAEGLRAGSSVLGAVVAGLGLLL